MQNYNFNFKNDLIIIINNEIIEPIGSVSLSRYFKDMPSEFDVEFLKSDSTNISLGNTVVVKYKDTDIFKGYIFVINESEDDTLKITAYDQLRYFNNEHTMTIKNITVSELLIKLCNEFKLNVAPLGNGVIDSGVDIAPKQAIIENKSLFQIISDGIDSTIAPQALKSNSINLFFFYDDAGTIKFNKLDPPNFKEVMLETDMIFDNDNITSYSYDTSIDSETYNKILVYSKVEDDEKEIRNLDMYIAEDPDTIGKWGVLQKVVNADNITKEQAKTYSQNLLKQYNLETITFKISTVGGDINIRGGTLVPIILKTTKREINQKCIVDKVTHTFDNNEYTMELELMGMY